MATCNAQKSIETIKMFVKSYNEKDSIQLKKLIHKDFTGYWEDILVIKNKTEFFKTFSSDKILNTYESIEVIQNTKDSIKTLNTFTSDYFKALNAKPLITQKTYHLKKGRIIKIIEKIPEKYQDYNNLRASVFNDFKLWLRDNYCMSPSQFDQSIKETKFLVKVSKIYNKELVHVEHKKETNEFLSAYKSYQLKKFIQEPNELELQEFIFRVINLLKEKKHTELLKLYITENEFIELFKQYGYNSEVAKQEYKENVFIPEIEQLKYTSEKRFFDCYMNYSITDNVYPKLTVFSEILRRNSAIKNKDEYYFSHALFKIKAWGYDYLDGYEIERDKTSDLNFGEVIYIPQKGWRLTQHIR